MAEFLHTLQLIGDVTALAVAIGAALAFVPHTFINEWIRARFAREVERESREHAARLQHDLEGYKNDLLGRLDEARLDIDLRRSIALQSAAAKLDAIRKLSVIVADYASLAASFPQLEPDSRGIHLEKLVDKGAEAMSARLEADIFLDLALSLSVAQLISQAQSLATDTMDGRPPVDAQDAAVVALNAKAGLMAHSLRLSFEELLASGHVRSLIAAEHGR